MESTPVSGNPDTVTRVYGPSDEGANEEAPAPGRGSYPISHSGIHNWSSVNRIRFSGSGSGLIGGRLEALRGVVMLPRGWVLTT